MKVRILYFVDLVDRLGRASEEAELPEAVTDIESLLAWLRGRGGEWGRALKDDAVKVTVNKQFVPPDTMLHDGDEIAVVPVQKDMFA